MSKILDVIEENKLNKLEQSFGPEMSLEETAKLFKEAVPQEKVEKLPETKEEFDKWEENQNNSTDIYKIKARVSNLFRESGSSINAAGEVLINSYVHVLKSLYDFAESLPEPHRQNLTDLIMSHEDMPKNIVSAAKNRK